MNRVTEKLRNTHCYLDDILIATVGSAKEHCKLVNNVSKTLNDRGLAIKWEKCKFVTHNIEWLRFKIDAKHNSLSTKIRRNWKFGRTTMYQGHKTANGLNQPIQ